MRCLFEGGYYTKTALMTLASIHASLSAYDTIVYWTWRATWMNQLFWTALCVCTMCTIRCGLQFVGDLVCYPRAQERLQLAHCVCEKGWRDCRPHTRWAIVDMWPVLPGILQFFRLFLPLMNCDVYSEAATTYFASPFIKCSVNSRVATKQGRASIYVNTIFVFSVYREGRGAKWVLNGV